MALSPDTDLAADLAARGIDPDVAQAVAAKQTAATDRLYAAEWDRYVEWCDDGDLDPADVVAADRYASEANPSERHFVQSALAWGKQNTAGES